MTTPKLVPTQDRVCAICGASETYSPQGEPHHVIPRSVGGLNGPTLDLCFVCHNRIDATGEWRVSLTDSRDGVTGWLYIIDQHGAIVLQRPREYLPDDLVATMLAEIEAVPEHLERLSYHFDRLPDYAIEPMVQAVSSIHTVTWPVMGRLLREIKRRIPYGSKGHEFEQVARQFDLSDRRAYHYIEAVDFAQDNPTFAVSSKVPVDVVLEAKKHDNPAAVLQEYEALRAENPRAGVTALRRALRDDPEIHQVQYHQCPECGANHQRRTE